MQSLHTQFDVIIAGAGMIGSSMALGLAKQGKRVAIVEKHMPRDYEVSQPPDLRVSAFTAGSQKLCQSLGAWDELERMRHSSFTRMSVWEEQHSATTFDAKEVDAPRLGYFFENRLIQLAYHQTLKNYEVTWFTPRTIVSLDNTDVARCELDDGSVIEGKLLLACDGGQSVVRKLAGIGVQGWQYTQQALGITIRTKAASTDTTWQEFTPNGPMAYLPMYDNFASLVWYNNPNEITRLKGLSKAALKSEVLAHYPDLLDDFEIIDCASFPLTRSHAKQYFQQSVVLVGDAAHTINPLAGQGVNIGFKDVSDLLDALAGNWHSSNERQVNLARYERKRRLDNTLVMNAMDVFYHTFSNDVKALKVIRNLGCKLANKSGLLKQVLIKYAMGI